MQHDPAGRISLHTPGHRVVVRTGGRVIADTDQSIELREVGYPARQYLAREHIDMARLVASETQTHCPFKGDARYYSLVLDNEVITDAAWSYEQPYAAMAEIAGRLAFDPEKVEQILNPAT